MRPSEPCASGVRYPATLFIVTGLSGAGKTTHARRLQERVDTDRLSADEWLDALQIDHRDVRARARAEGAQRQIARELLIQGRSVVIEWGCWSRSERTALWRLACSVGATTALHHIDPPPDLTWHRLTLRNDRPIPTRQDFLRSVAAFEPIRSDEARLHTHFVHITEAVHEATPPFAQSEDRRTCAPFEIPPPPTV